MSKNLMPAFRATLRDHIPYRKLKHEVEESICEVCVQDYAGDGVNPEPWTAISLAESYLPEGGHREVARTIYITLRAEQRAELLAMLLRQEVAA